MAPKYEPNATLNAFEDRFLPPEVAEAVKAFKGTKEGIDKARTAAAVAKKAAEKAHKEGETTWRALRTAAEDADHAINVARKADREAWDVMFDANAKHREPTLAKIKAGYDKAHEKNCKELQRVERAVEEMEACAETHRFVIAPVGKLAQAAGGAGTTEAERMELLMRGLRLSDGYVELSKAIGAVLEPSPPPGQKLDGQTGTPKQTRETVDPAVAAKQREENREQAVSEIVEKTGWTPEEAERRLEGDEAEPEAA